MTARLSTNPSSAGPFVVPVGGPYDSPTPKKRIRAAVAASGISLMNIRGFGPIGAAIILGSVGDIARFPLS